MPYYKFHDTHTDKVWEEFLKISERDEYLKNNPHVEQLVNGFPADADSVKLGRTKPADGFRDMLKQIKKNNIRSTVNTNW